MSSSDPLRDVFKAFCSFGDRGSTNAQIDGAKFAKLCKDCKLVDKKVTPTQVDLIFTKSKEKASRKITYEQFVDALKKLATVKYPEKNAEEAFETVRQQVLDSQGPASHGTAAQADGIYGKLTDTKQYTGAHKERFDHTGRGRGKEGREDVSGASKDLSEMTRNKLTVSEDRNRRGSDGDAPTARRSSTEKVASKEKRASASSTGSDQRAKEAMPQPTDLRTIFYDFCNFGGAGTLQEMDNPKWGKLCRESGIVTKKYSSTDADLVFAKVKPRGKRTLNYQEFQNALQMIAQQKYPDDPEGYDKLVDLVVQSGGPKTKGTGSSTEGIYAKLTDASQYTGAHKHRFDKTGHGRGLAGRDSVGTSGNATYRPNLK